MRFVTLVERGSGCAARVVSTTATRRRDVDILAAHWDDRS
jgi:hypothetical protein